ncbi:MAG: hypothetical protein ACLVJH_15180 [Faecalibacterium prausnitzii]
MQSQQGENAEAIRRDIAGILHTLNQAYDNLYDKLLSDVALDVSSEIAALAGDAGERWSGRGGIAMTYRAWNTKTADRAALERADSGHRPAEHRRAGIPEHGRRVERRKSTSSVLAAQQKEAGLLAGILAARGITDPAEALTLTGGRRRAERPHAADRHGQSL